MLSALSSTSLMHSTAALGSATLSSTNASALRTTRFAAAGSLTTETLQALYDFNTVIMTAARVPQIWSNYKVGNKPVTSLIQTVHLTLPLMNACGCRPRAQVSSAFLCL